MMNEEFTPRRLKENARTFRALGFPVLAQLAELRAKLRRKQQKWGAFILLEASEVLEEIDLLCRMGAYEAAARAKRFNVSLAIPPAPEDCSLPIFEEIFDEMAKGPRPETP